MSETKRLCNIVGCPNLAIEIKRPPKFGDFGVQVLSSGEFCLQHFNEIYNEEPEKA